ncbi:hypothetical protein TMO_a0594 (plasmid) [Tistrella mobilis KA081020-065]|uniref:Uncharacterized protein n=1 Tax=Tistrella mobilis (strain KA081020-065) TaxID=1110502 RepID=I3TTA9_TISMK|nr:hypothetical protein TMO_a0594 [Tistrella mobilis KA081020-065]
MMLSGRLWKAGGCDARHRDGSAIYVRRGSRIISFYGEKLAWNMHLTRRRRHRVAAGAPEGGSSNGYNRGLFNADALRGEIGW